MYLTDTHESEVFEIIKSLDNKTSSGEDEICVLVKTTKQIVTPLLTYLINLSFNKGKFPGEFKKAKILPRHKGYKTDENYYRPMSLLVIWSTIFERMMFNRLYHFFEKFSLFTNRQFGFCKNSTIDALTHLIEKYEPIRTTQL